MLLRIENFRNGAWQLRGESEIDPDTDREVIHAQADSCALNCPTRALVNGTMIYEIQKLSRKRAKQLFGV